MITVSIRNSNFSLLSSSSLFSVPRFVSDLKKPSLYPQVSRSQIVFWHLFKKSEFSHFHRDIYIQIYFENMGYALTVIWKDVCLISIDTSAKEVTKKQNRRNSYCRISIHTSAKEVTIGYKFQLLTRLISIHTSAKEVTSDDGAYAPVTEFQSTLPRRK